MIDRKSSSRLGVFLRSRSVQPQPERRLEVNASNNSFDCDKGTKPKYESEIVLFHTAIGEWRPQKQGSREYLTTTFKVREARFC